MSYLPGETTALLELAGAAFCEGAIEVALDWARQECRIDPARIPGKLARECGLALAIALRTTDDVVSAERSCTDGWPAQWKRVTGGSRQTT